MTNNDLVPEISKAGFDDFTKEGVVLIDFFAEWCMPCLTMAPILDELSEKLKGEVKIGKVNIEDNSELAQKFDVASIPNFTIFKDGKVVDQIVGSVLSDELEDTLKKHL